MSGPPRTLTVQRSRSGVISAFLTMAICWPPGILDLHRVLHPQHALLDLAQLAAGAVLKEQRLPHAQRLAVDLENPLAALVLDPEVVADRDQVLPHLVAVGAAAAKRPRAASPWSPIFPAFFPSVSS